MVFSEHILFPCEKLVFSPTLPQAVFQGHSDVFVALVSPVIPSTSLDTSSTPHTANAAPTSFLPSTLATSLFTNTIVAATVTNVRIGTLETGTQPQMMMMEALESRDRVIVGLAVSTSILAGFIVGYLIHRVRRRASRSRNKGNLGEHNAVESEPQARVTEEVPSPPSEPEPVHPNRLESELSLSPVVSPTPLPTDARSGVRWDFLNDDPFDDVRRVSRTSSLPSYRSEDPDQTSSVRIE